MILEKWNECVTSEKVSLPVPCSEEVDNAVETIFSV